MGSEELKALGQRNGWSVRELSPSEIAAMSADETLWHEMFNRKSFNDALARAENQRVNKVRMAEWDSHKKWQGITPVTEQEAELARKTGEEFALRMPTFARTLDNAMKIVKWLEQNDRDATDLRGYFDAFRTLSAAGELELIKPQSANEYLAEHPELKDTRIPEVIQRRQQKAHATEQFFATARAATTEGSAVRIVDYPSEPSGYPPAPTKYSFRKLLDSLDAESYRKRINDDPVFAAAVDKLQNGK